MCDPGTLAIAATAAAVVGQGVGALQTAATNRYQARVAEANARMEDESARSAIEATKTEATAQQRRIAQLQGQQQAAMAANGISTNFGSASQVKDDTAMLGREDVGRIYDQGYQRTRGFDINAANDRAQAAGYRQAASGALVKGGFDMVSTALGGAQQFGTMKSRYKNLGHW